MYRGNMPKSRILLVGSWTSARIRYGLTKRPASEEHEQQIQWCGLEELQMIRWFRMRHSAQSSRLLDRSLSLSTQRAYWSGIVTPPLGSRRDRSMLHTDHATMRAVHLPLHQIQSVPSQLPTFPLQSAKHQLAPARHSPVLFSGISESEVFRLLLTQGDWHVSWRAYSVLHDKDIAPRAKKQ